MVVANSKALAPLASTHIHDIFYLLDYCFFFFYVLSYIILYIIAKSAKNKSESESESGVGNESSCSNHIRKIWFQIMVLRTNQIAIL